METLGSRFGTCACGGAFEEHVVAVTAPGKGRKKGGELLEVEEGVCPVCGSRVYKTQSLQSVEAAFRVLKLHAGVERLRATRSGSGRSAGR